jgi:hypothetical protein
MMTGSDFRSGFRYEYDDYSDSTGSMEEELEDPYDRPIPSSSTSRSFNVLGAIKRSAKILKRERANDESPVIAIRNINQSHTQESDNNSYLSATSNDSDPSHVDQQMSPGTSVSGQSFCNDDYDTNSDLLSSSSDLINKTGSKLRSTLRTMTASISSDSTRRRFDLSKQFRKNMNKKDFNDEELSTESDRQIDGLETNETPSFCDASVEVDTPPSSHPFDENSEYGINHTNMHENLDVNIQGSSDSESFGQDEENTADEHADVRNAELDRFETESKNDSSVQSDQDLEYVSNKEHGPRLTDRLLDSIAHNHTEKDSTIDAPDDNGLGQNVAEVLLSPVQVPSDDYDQITNDTSDDQSSSTLDEETLAYESQFRERSLLNVKQGQNANPSKRNGLLNVNKYKCNSYSFGNDEFAKETDDEAESESDHSSLSTDDIEQRIDDVNDVDIEDDETFVDDISLFQYGTVTAVENFLDEIASTKGIQNIGGMILRIGNWFGDEDKKCDVEMDSDIFATKGYDMDSVLSDEILGGESMHYKKGRSMSLSPIALKGKHSNIRSLRKENRESPNLKKENRTFDDDDEFNIQSECERKVDRSLFYTLFGCANGSY